jgi:hypothetical protein
MILCRAEERCLLGCHGGKMMNAFWEMRPRGSSKVRHFGEYFDSIFIMLELWVYLTPRLEMPHDGRVGDPHATAPPQLCLRVTMESLLSDRPVVKYF